MARLCLALVTLVAAVDRSKFRKCGDTRFCRVHRQPDKSLPGFSVDASSVAMHDNGRLTMVVSDGARGPLQLSLEPLADDGVVRMRIVEIGRETPRWEPTDILLNGGDFPLQRGVLTRDDLGLSLVLGDGTRVAVTYAPFSLELFGLGDAEVPLAVVNSKQLMHFERGNAGQLASVEVSALGDSSASSGGSDVAASACAAGLAWNGDECREIVGYWEDGLARFADGGVEVKKAPQLVERAVVEDDGHVSESFGGHTDDVPHGPTSLGLDVFFPLAEALFGLAEHASQFALKATTGGAGAYEEPYRFYNLDVFEYELDEPMALYGTIPLVWGQSTSRPSTVGAFWNNPSETFVDVSSEEGKGWGTRWLSESGVVELFLIASADPMVAFAKYASLTGAQELPPAFALGYHQCRWNYKDEKDVAQVHAKFEELDIPFDVLWLDIEHTDGKRYFTWDSNLFPTPEDMQRKLAETGRKMVTIVDPHVKRDESYKTHVEASRLGLYVKDKSGTKDFEGWCWPGSSSYLDFTQEHVRKWWAEQFALDVYAGSTPDLYIWNDMNEPSVFNGPEVTMAKTHTSLAGVEHREWHNLYGMYYQRATAEGLVLRDQALDKRPFVLSRAFYAGSQRWGAVWTGDNTANWDHLRVAAPMLLSVSVCGLSFCGADAGGFFGDPDAELMTRWLQAAAYTPFFRGHAHHDAKRREPWSFGEPHTARLRAAIAQRYQLLPYWYTLFAQARFDGQPVMRPLWAHFPADERALRIDDAWLVGDALLVHPVVHKGTTKANVYLPASGGGGAASSSPQVWWFDAEHPHAKRLGGRSHSVDAPIDHVPVFQRGGSVVPRQRRLRRSTQAMATDPYELTVALDSAGQAQGELFLDDGTTFGCVKRGAFARTSFTFAKKQLTAQPAEASTRAQSLGVQISQADAAYQAPANQVERLIVLGLDAKPTRVVHAQDARDLETTWDATAKKLTLRKPQLAAAGGWTLRFELEP